MQQALLVFLHLSQPFLLLHNWNWVPKEGVEPSRGVTSADFESAASADSATSAGFRLSTLKRGEMES